MYESRLKRLKSALANAKLDGVAAIAGPNLYYLTGLSFHLSERPTVGFFPAQGDPVFVVGALEESKISAGAPFKVRTFAYTDADGPLGAFGEASRALKLGPARLGVESRRMRVMEYQFLQEAFPGLQIDPAEEIFALLRMAKDKDEIALMRRATEIAEAALKATLPQIKVGLTEREVAAELVVQTLRAGSDADLPFAPIVASGSNSALPHAFVTNRRLAAGDLLTLDWGAATGGYFSDLTRTFALGQLDPELKKIYDLVQKANAAGRLAARPGVTCASVDLAARQVIAAGGYGEYFTHRVGHGLGLEGHEDPSMHGKNMTRLEAGMTFTVEPGIYLPGHGGVRIEDDVVVTADGAESLSSYPRDLQTIG